MSERIVVHHGSPRWIEVDGVRYDVLYGGPGWGYFIPMPGGNIDGYFTLAEVRQQAADDIRAYLEETPMNDCGKDGCYQPAVANGYCATHADPDSAGLECPRGHGPYDPASLCPACVRIGAVRV